jgi:hypothetical protein
MRPCPAFPSVSRHHFFILLHSSIFWRLFFSMWFYLILLRNSVYLHNNCPVIQIIPIRLTHFFVWVFVKLFMFFYRVISIFTSFHFSFFLGPVSEDTWPPHLDISFRCALLAYIPLVPPTCHTYILQASYLAFSTFSFVTTYK